ncbi:MAG: hypothetical protein HY606_10645, partial [Planctomycetes bacterium]|nr:hypothetical protein [Planctomycetota bacterium]
VKMLKNIKIFILIITLLQLYVTTASANGSKLNTCLLTCEQKFGPAGSYRGLEDLTTQLIKDCGGYNIDSSQALACNNKYLDEKKQCDNDCKIYLTDPCFGECESNYKICLDGCYNVYKVGIKSCIDGYIDTCYNVCNDKCYNNSECRISIQHDFDGVAADGISNITFNILTDGDNESVNLYITSKENGQVYTESYYGYGHADFSGTKMIFTAREPNVFADYLEPKELTLVAECTNTEGNVYNASQSFVIVEPPIFLVHGIWSSALTWSSFEAWLRQDGFVYDDISYPASQSMRKDSILVKDKLHSFLEDIKSGKYYGGKKISVTKADVVAHSQGGLITRYYTLTTYEGNIRKFVMLGTPNHGAGSASYFPRFLKTIGQEAVQQLKPDSEFIQGLNSQPLAKGIDHHTIAGTGWFTITDLAGTFTWNGDGIVPAESVQLYGATMYCTYDAHSSQVPDLVSAKIVQQNSGATLTASKKAYGLTKSILLTGFGEGGVECEVQETHTLRGVVRSPASLHAYAENGSHVGINNGKLENEIGHDAAYSNESGHESITIYSDKKVKFVIAGEKEGQFGFDLLEAQKNGTFSTTSFDNVSIDERTQYSINPSDSKAELVKENKKSIEQFKNQPICGSAFVILASVLLICYLSIKPR